MTTRTTSPSVGELMSIEPITIGVDEAIGRAEQLMSERSITGLPVVDRLGRLQGVLSQTDLVRAHASGQPLASWPGLAVRHLMTSPALTIRIDENAIKVSTHPELPVEAGGQIWLRFLEGKIRWIDRDTGRAITPPLDQVVA